jgi:hypothetical protein
METPQSKPVNKKDILFAFGDRVLWKPEKIKREYLGLDENLMERDLIESDIADKYEHAQISDPNTFDHFGIRGKILSCSLLKKGFNPIGLSIFKNMRDDESWYALGINKGNPINKEPKKVYERFSNTKERIGDFYLYTKEDGNFYIPDRYVWPKYRGPQNKGDERISNVLLKACEQIVQSHANKEGKGKTLEVDAAQIDVMMWLNTNGYIPKTDQDKERFQKIINADKNLIIVRDNFIWEKDQWREGANVFEDRGEAFRVVFEKKIEPKPENPTEVVEDIRGRVQTV